MRPLLALLSGLFGVAGCIPDYEDAPTKLVGVGYDPTEIGPSPTPYGGVLEYSWVNFAGAGLSPAMMGLVSYEEVGPGLAGFSPPYAAVFGFSYVFDQQLAAADSLAGVTSVPPDTDDSCYTTYEASGPVGSFKTVDVGSRISLLTADGRGLALDRYPTDYPPDPQGAFVYYIALDSYVAQSLASWLPGGTDRPSSMTSTVVRPANFPFGEPVSFSFPGGLPPAIAPVASVPLPSAAAGPTAYTLPDAPGNVMLSWSGPSYDAWGHPVGAGGDTSACLAWPLDPSLAPAVPADCQEADRLPSDDTPGRVYTGPWDAENGEVTFHWEPGERTDEYVSLTVRFLGPVDRDNPALAERVVPVAPDSAANAAWSEAQRSGAIPNSLEVPEGRRPAMPCEADAAWTLDDDYLTASGDLVPALRGDPSHNVAEVTCRLRDDGEFALTAAMIADAQAYARRAGAEGAIFTFARSTDTAAAIPAARDTYGQRLDISPMKLTSRAIDIGRFWYEKGD